MPRGCRGFRDWREIDRDYVIAAGEGDTTTSPKNLILGEVS